MLPTPATPEPPNQGSQFEANTPEDRPARRGGLGRFFRNLFYLSRATEAEVARQAQDRVKRRIEEIKIEEKLKEKFTDEIQETANKIKDKMRIEKNDVKKFAEEKKKEIDKLREKLKGRINGLIYLLILLGIITFPLIPYIIQDFSLIKTLETQIKHLESDIEDLQDDRDTS